MMRLPRFRYLAPTTPQEVAEVLASEGPDAMVVAGGTDLLPNMKRRQQTPKTVVGLKGVTALRESQNGSGLRLGAGLTLSEIGEDPRVRQHYGALHQAAVQVASPHLRNMATLGGNICLDTRCNYYDQNYEWRKSINFCMKKEGETCWVALASKRCLAVSSTDTAPALIALGARVNLLAAREERELPLEELYQNDGIAYLTRRPHELLTRIELPDATGWKSTYWKLRRRGSFDFPVLGVAAAVKFDAGGGVADARIVLGAVASSPIVVNEAAEMLIGKELTDGVIEEAAEKAGRKAKPMDNTDFVLHWRKRVAQSFVGYALRELRGDDMSETRWNTAKIRFGDQ